jgi:hypothetical protein
LLFDVCHARLIFSLNIKEVAKIGKISGYGNDNRRNKDYFNYFPLHYFFTNFDFSTSKTKAKSLRAAITLVFLNFQNRNYSYIFGSGKQKSIKWIEKLLNQPSRPVSEKRYKAPVKLKVLICWYIPIS